MIGHMFTAQNIANLEERGRPMWQMTNNHPIANLALLRQHHQMREFFIRRKLANILHPVRTPRIIKHVRYQLHQITDKFEEFARGFGACREQEFRTGGIREISL
eukprot:CAMPEP_0171305998 /NCGR_PEP_ID=MMETSP0816-20121228/15910_1 /TAXON_ID=420281 /ORGANISM="Proboscia inermis, Strain CCAP1064/1" /LENGTH=103 /DNA_ID=CAMNT_0011787251 /DNA_START=69 /DNA_END=376 /DNA_ORIENTATION=-